MRKYDHILRIFLVFVLLIGTSPYLVRGQALSGDAVPAPDPNPAAVHPEPTPAREPAGESAGEPAPDQVDNNSPGTNDTPAAPATPAPEKPGQASVTPTRSPEPPLPSRGTVPSTGYLVLGYYTRDYPTDKGSQTTLTANSQCIDIVSPFQYAISGSGKLTGEDFTALSQFVRETDKPVLVLIHNYQGKGFSSAIAHTLLSSSQNRAAAVQNIYNLVESEGYVGVHVDLENIPASDRNNYTQFITELKTKFSPAGYLVTLAVPAKTSEKSAGSWGVGFDYAALGKVADQITLMTYDEHWFGGAAGPIASIDWVENVIKYALKHIPRQKLFLGIPSYGYDWGENGKNKALSAAKAIRQADDRGVAIEWDSQAQAPYYHYWVDSIKHTVYFENARSTAPKLDLVRQYELAGISIWKLGTEDAAIWPLIGDKLAK